MCSVQTNLLSAILAMSSKASSRQSTTEQLKHTRGLQKPNSNKSDLDSTSSHRSGTSASSSDESKSEVEPALKERRKRSIKKPMKSAGKLVTIPWCVLITSFWILDIGRNIIRLWEHSPNRIPSNIMIPTLAILTVGCSIQIVSDSVIARLTSLGFDHALSVEDNTLMQFVKPRELIDIFKHVIHIGTGLGYYLWVVSLLLALFAYFVSCFIKKSSHIPEGIQQLTTTSWLILVPLAVYLWYIVSEYQLVGPFLILLSMVILYQAFEFSLHRVTDINGQLLLQSFGITLVFLLTWKFLVWGDKNLSGQYPGLLGIPQPWTYVRMYIHSNVGDPSVFMSEPDEIMQSSSPVLSVTVSGASQ
ncbi:ceroid-lipofuscinosis neuronal protein 6-like isoform X2 [Ptychodera flava]|uniref:ceroid-lipofuscinosis neuronal protein 6-like isoform X2 n=1 Tax=Ptychodera flava TaxID=63121 RepID=UPI00396A346A